MNLENFDSLMYLREIAYRTTSKATSSKLMKSNKIPKSCKTERIVRFSNIQVFQIVRQTSECAGPFVVHRGCKQSVVFNVTEGQKRLQFGSDQILWKTLNTVFKAWRSANVDLVHKTSLWSIVSEQRLSY
jgi:hypothetical protein